MASPETELAAGLASLGMDPKKAAEYAASKTPENAAVEALRQLYQIADELDAEICEQTLDKAEDDLPDDAELTVNITVKQFRQLTRALHTAALALGRAA